MSLNHTMFDTPLPDAEVVRVVESAWSKEQAGENWFGCGGRIVMKADEVDGLLHEEPDAFILLLILRRHHWGRDFVIANAMARKMPGSRGWRTKRPAAARRRLVEIGAIEQIRAPSRRYPALYRFNDSQI